MPNYYGEFGFDWLRDEYIYDIVPVGRDNYNEYEVNRRKGTPIAFETNKIPLRLYQNNVQGLINEYLNYQEVDEKGLSATKSIADVTNDFKIATSGTPYTPAWLSIFPKNYPTSPHIDGVELYLTIEQEQQDTTDLAQENIILEFMPSGGIEVVIKGGDRPKKQSENSPATIKLAELVKSTPIPIKLSTFDNQVPEKSIKYYENIDDNSSNKYPHIKIIATKAFDKPAFIKVIATKEGRTTTKNVGLLMIYPNGKIPKAEIVVVNVLTRQGQTEINKAKNYRSAIVNNGLNQALIDCQVSIAPDFNLIELQNRFQEENDVKAQELKKFLKDYPSQIIDSGKSSILRDRIVNLYELLVIQKNEYINTDLNKKTYLFITDYRLKLLGGTTAVKHADFSKCTGEACIDEWGNSVVIFDAGLYATNTYIHELGHSFSLTHTFEKYGNPPKHTFYQAYIDNVMDYNDSSYHNIKDDPQRTIEYDNKFRGYMTSFFKWQWDIMRADRSSIYP